MLYIKKINNLTLLPAVAMVAMLLAVAPARAETVDRIVAKVNGDVILNSEVQERLRVLEKGAPQLNLQNPENRAKVEKDVLRQMVRERLTDQEVTRLKISVQKAEVDKKVEDKKQENHLTDAQMEYVLVQEGTTLDKFRERVKQELEHQRLMERVLQSKVMITESQIDEAQQRMASGSGAGARRHLAVIFLPVANNGGGDALEKVDAQAKKIHEQLVAGADFAKMAREYSKGPAVNEGGDIGYMAVEDLAAPIEQVTRGLGPGQLTSVVTTSAGCYIFKVLDVEKSAAVSSVLTGGVNVEQREKIRRKLMQEEMGRKYDEWIRDLESKSEIEMLEPAGSNPTPIRPSS